jgi:DNA-binding Lrp family transcriptional regulator
MKRNEYFVLMGNMDKTDLKILQYLQKNGRASAQQVADAVGLSAAPVWRRVKSLESSGAIRGYNARISRSHVGLHGCMFTQIGLERHSAEIVDNFIRAVRGAPEILECYAVTGDADFLLKVLVESAEAYDDFLHRFLFNLPGVRQTRTIVALREIKHEVELPLAP